MNIDDLEGLGTTVWSPLWTAATVMAQNASYKLVKYHHLWNYNPIGITIEITLCFSINNWLTR